MINLDDYSEYVAWCRIIIAGIDDASRTPEKIRETIFEQELLKMTPELAEAIARFFEQQYEVRQKFGSSIKERDFKPWLKGRANDIDPYYWSRFKKYLLEQNGIMLPTQVVRVLDETTDEILDFSGDPCVEDGFQRRGMVIGQVQSGKTLNYSALICKAADAGYKVIIILSGITSLLRRQTQDRIDHAFIGRKSVFENVYNPKIGAANYATTEKFPSYGTTIDRDFNLNAAQNFGVQIGNLREPIIFVTKKNVSTLSNLRQWLRISHQGGSIEHPLLLIDDEADNASINTRDRLNEVTRINKGIRDILQQFDKASYVAYTATPFANIFISPETRNEMLGADLFPKDYIKALDAPTNYIGPENVFTTGEELADLMVREPDDYQDILPVSHKNHTPVPVLPESLVKAFSLFVLVRAIRVFQGKGKAHCSMMVNVSRFNSVQENVNNRLYELLNETRDEIRLYSKKKDAVSNSTILGNLRDLYEEEYFQKQSGDEPPLPAWQEIQEKLLEAISTIVVKVVNMRGEPLEYDGHSSDGLHVIAVGGLALSRGLTLEGLCVSYILRNPSAYDTLMQMGRWFGYRPGYHRLCRLFIPGFARDYYEHITRATEELREEIKRMKALEMTPKDFGLKVREHPEAIRITAANKMDSATPINISINYEHRHLEGHTVKNDKNINELNRNKASELLGALGNPVPIPDVNTTRLFWRGVAFEEIKKFISGFQLPRQCAELFVHANNGRSLAIEYMEGRRMFELSEWDVAVVENQNSKSKDDMLVPGETISKRMRGGNIIEDVFRIGRGRVADKIDSSIGLHNESIKNIDIVNDINFNDVRKYPLLIVHCFDARVQENREVGSLVSYSICFPKTSVVSEERKYQVNQVWTQMNAFDSSGYDDTDEDQQVIYE